MSLDRILFTSVCSAVSLTMILLYVSFLETDRMADAVASRHGINVELGAALYSTHCTSCHGVRGEGVGQLGPSLADAHFFTKRLEEVGWHSGLEEYIVGTTTHGRMIGTRSIYAGNGSTAVMPPWDRHYGGPLRQDEIVLLAAFIANWEATASGRVQLTALELPGDNPADPERVSRGETVFKQACSRCHVYKSKTPSMVTGPDLSEIAVRAALHRDGQDAPEYIRESILIPEAYVDRTYAEVAESNACGGTLTITELNAVTAFLLQ